MARLTTNGTQDSAFGSGGVVSTPLPGSAVATAVALQTDAKIVAVGAILDNNTGLANFVLTRYTGK